MKSTRKGLGKGRGTGYKNMIRSDPVVHQRAGKGQKTYSSVTEKKMMQTPHITRLPNFTLYDPSTDEQFSANAGDYWDVPDDHIFKNEEGDEFWLMKDGEVIKKQVKKSDLKDEIYESQKKQTRFLKKRKAPESWVLGKEKGKYLHIELDNGESYVVDTLGRITQQHRFAQDKNDFSGQWALYGVTKHHWSNTPIMFDEIIKNPEILKGGYIWDLDNGTIRQWSGRKVKYIYARD